MGQGQQQDVEEQDEAPGTAGTDSDFYVNLCSPGICTGVSGDPQLMAVWGRSCLECCGYPERGICPILGGGCGRTAAVSREGPWSPGPLKTLLFCRERRDRQVSGQHLLPYLWLGKAELPKRCVQAAGGQGLDEGGRGGTLDALPQLEHPL